MVSKGLTGGFWAGIRQVAAASFRVRCWRIARNDGKPLLLHLRVGVVGRSLRGLEPYLVADFDLPELAGPLARQAMVIGPRPPRLRESSLRLRSSEAQSISANASVGSRHAPGLKRRPIGCHPCDRGTRARG